MIYVVSKHDFFTWNLDLCGIKARICWVESRMNNGNSTHYRSYYDK